MTISLPSNPSLENLKKQAKALKKAWQQGEALALQRIREFHPQYAHASDENLRTAKPRLTDCQLVLARECGADSWLQLKVAVESTRIENDKELPDQFVTVACLCYDDPHFDHRSFHARAYDMLQQNPYLAEANIWCAATAGNTAVVKAFLDKNPELVNRPGPNGWAPLFCACYSRVKPLEPAHSTFEVAKLLLARSADPNAYTMKGNADERLDQTAHRYTALTGLFGGGPTGMANQPPHPQWRELAELLLAHGANPADEQAVEIGQGQGPTYEKLEILLRHCLKPDARSQPETNGGITLMGLALSQVARSGDTESVRLLLAHEARTDETFRGKTPWQHAMERGHLEIARLLEAAHAPVLELNEVQRFVSLCVAGDERGARALLERCPDLVPRAPKELVLKATGGGRIEAVKLVLDLGFDPNYMDEVTAVQNAAGGNKEEIVRLLLQRGASLTIRDPFYDGTAIGWADFYDHEHLRDFLLSDGAICLFDALNFERLDRVPDILARDSAALNRPFAECLSRDPKPQDWQTPVVRMVDQGKMEAVRALLNQGADITARNFDRRSLVQLARDKGFEEIAGLLQQHGAAA